MVLNLEVISIDCYYIIDFHLVTIDSNENFEKIDEQNSEENNNCSPVDSLEDLSTGAHINRQFSLDSENTEL